jgi:hypothetical protein
MCPAALSSASRFTIRTAPAGVSITPLAAMALNVRETVSREAPTICAIT